MTTVKTDSMEYNTIVYRISSFIKFDISSGKRGRTFFESVEFKLNSIQIQKEIKLLLNRLNAGRRTSQVTSNDILAGQETFQVPVFNKFF